eukprot:g31648.t1
MPTGLPCGAMPTGPTGLTGPAVGMPLTTPAPVAPAPTVQMPNDGWGAVAAALGPLGYATPTPTAAPAAPAAAAPAGGNSSLLWDMLGLNNWKVFKCRAMGLALFDEAMSASCLRQDICLSILNRDDFTEVNAIDQFGYTILSLAASNSMVGVCKAILDHPEFTQVNSKDWTHLDWFFKIWGATALHWAAASNLGSVCTGILEHPAFVEAHVVAFSFKFENQTALQVAEERGCADAEQAIKKALSVLTTADLQRAAKRLNVELRENVAGPWYQIELYSGDRQLGKTSGWAQPWGSLHLETIEARFGEVDHRSGLTEHRSFIAHGFLDYKKRLR